MSESQQRNSKRVPVALRIKLRFRKLDTFISKFATNISSTGMFISSRKPREAGTQLRFELRLADDSTVIAGKGRVVWVRDYDPEHPKKPHGMGIEFVSLNKGSRELIERIVEHRLEQGLGESEDIPHQLPQLQTPIDAAAQTTDETPAKDVPAQDPEPAPRSPGVVELSLDDLESAPVDLEAVLRRARAIVGDGDADDELNALFRVSSAPIAETVDDASQKLAILLGGQAVSARRHYADPATDHAGLSDYAEAPQEAASEAVLSDEPSALGENDESELAEHESFHDVPTRVANEALPVLEDSIGAPLSESAADAAVALVSDRAISVDDEQLLDEQDVDEHEAANDAAITANVNALEPDNSDADAHDNERDEGDFRNPKSEAPTVVGAAKVIDIRDEGDFRHPSAESPTQVNAELSATLALDDALSSSQSPQATPHEPQPEPEAQSESSDEPDLDAALAFLELDSPPEEQTREEPMREADFDDLPSIEDEEPVELTRADDDEGEVLDADDLMEFDMLEDGDGPETDYQGASPTSVPSGIDVGVLDPGGLEDNGIYELSKPGTGPIDLLKLADLPAARPLDDDEDYDNESELDLPERPPR